MKNETVDRLGFLLAGFSTLLSVGTALTLLVVTFIFLFRGEYLRVVEFGLLAIVWAGVAFAWSRAALAWRS